jgi:hypothetical protein
MKKKLTDSQIGELVDLDRVCGGIGDEVATLIKRLTDGRSKLNTNDPRSIQTKVLWDKGWGTALEFTSFDSYHDSIVKLAGEIPERPPIDYLDKLVLVDRRVQLVDGCRMAGIKFNGSNETFKPYDEKVAKKHGDVYWMWCQDGHRNRNKKPSVCRTEFIVATGGVNREVGLDEFEFVSIYVQDPTVIGTKENPHSVDLLGAVHAVNSDDIACGGYQFGELKLYWYWSVYAYPQCGSASRWEFGPQS